jgi:hypothetical protein
MDDRERINRIELIDRLIQDLQRERNHLDAQRTDNKKLGDVLGPRECGDCGQVISECDCN